MLPPFAKSPCSTLQHCTQHRQFWQPHRIMHLCARVAQCLYTCQKYCDALVSHMSYSCCQCSRSHQVLLIVMFSCRTCFHSCCQCSRSHQVLRSIVMFSCRTCLHSCCQCSRSHQVLQAKHLPIGCNLGIHFHFALNGVHHYKLNLRHRKFLWVVSWDSFNPSSERNGVNRFSGRGRRPSRTPQQSVTSEQQSSYFFSSDQTIVNIHQVRVQSSPGCSECRRLT